MSCYYHIISYHIIYYYRSIDYRAPILYNSIRGDRFTTSKHVSDIGFMNQEGYINKSYEHICSKRVITRSLIDFITVSNLFSTHCAPQKGGHVYSKIRINAIKTRVLQLHVIVIAIMIVQQQVYYTIIFNGNIFIYNLICVRFSFNKLEI